MKGLIQKSGYIKPGSGGGHYAEYIATRDGVELMEPMAGGCLLYTSLVTKILLGTLGCVPTYDRYYVKSVKQNGISSGLYNSESVRKVAEFYCRNLEVFEKLRHELSKCGTNYSPMKLMDMCFWQDSYIKELATQ